MRHSATVVVDGVDVDLEGLDPAVEQAFRCLSHADRAAIARGDRDAEARLLTHLRRIRGGVPNRAARRAGRRTVTRKGMPRDR